jgi:hypothetical protein
MSEMMKGVLAGTAGVVVFLALLFPGVGYLTSDEKGMPVPTPFGRQMLADDQRGWTCSTAASPSTATTSSCAGKAVAGRK